MVSIITEKSPHLRRKGNLPWMLLDVIIALTPTIIFSLVVYQFDAMRNILISVATMVLAEFVYVLIVNRVKYDGKKHSLKEHFLAAKKKYTLSNFLAPVVSGLIFALIMPARTNPSGLIYVALVLGGLFGIVIGKLVFGGTGSNIFNPAGVGMVFAKLCFGSNSRFIYPARDFYSTPGGTPLTNNVTEVMGLNTLTGKWVGINDVSILDLFLGQVGGTIGEAFKVTILIGLVYLLVRRSADWRVVVGYLGTFIVTMALAGAIICTRHDIDFFHFMLFQLLSGGMLFGVTFMLTDPVSMPINSPGRFIYGILAASITCLVRLFGALPEGVIYSILIANMVSPALDYYKWSSVKWNRLYVIIACSILGVTLLATGLGLGFGGEVAA